MHKTKNILWDAERLAAFANAEGRQAVEEFKANNPDFLPASFWEAADLPVPGELFFGVDFSDLLNAMGLGATNRPKLGEPGNPIKLPRWWGEQQGVRRAWELRFPLDRCVIFISTTHGETPFQVWPFQRAVMFLGMEPWRARFCPVCGKRFVADKPARRYCSTACSGKARKGTRAASWKRHGEKWRTRHEKKKRASKRGRRAKP